MKMSTFGILDWTSYMKALQAIEEILNRVFKWHRFPVSLKQDAQLTRDLGM
jgi:hypothetical protein